MKNWSKKDWPSNMSFSGCCSRLKWRSLSLESNMVVVKGHLSVLTVLFNNFSSTFCLFLAQLPKGRRASAVMKSSASY